MYKLSFVLLAALALHGCGGTTAAARPSVPPVSTVEFERWYVVIATSGPGLSAGSGVRFGEAGFDVASHGMGQPMGGSCTRGAEGIDCQGFGGELSVRPRADGAQVAHQGPIDLVLGEATAEQARTWSDAVDATARRTVACRATADCCVAISNASGTECDVEAYLGDRSQGACEAGLASLRQELAASGRELPAECR